MLRITFILYAQNNLHQVCSEWLFQKHVMHTKSDIYIFIMGYDPNYEISHIWKITEYFIFHPILVHVCFLNWLYWDLAVKWQQSFTISDLYKGTTIFLTLGYIYMTKTLNQIIIFFLHQNQNIFFINIGNQNIFLEKNHNPTLSGCLPSTTTPIKALYGASFTDL
jgi:hypothetical protein